MHPIRHAVRTNAGVKGDARLQRVKCMRKLIGGMFAWRTTENPRWEVMAAHYYFRYLVRYESLQGVSHDHARH